MGRQRPSRASPTFTKHRSWNEKIHWYLGFSQSSLQQMHSSVGAGAVSSNPKSKVPSYLAKRMRRRSDLPLPNVHIKSAANDSGSPLPLKKKGILEKGKLVGIHE
eukprot:scaffold84584_cov57-Attheya_sp.AAC.1